MKSSANKLGVFISKEFTENLRTKRVLVLACVYTFLAITSVLLARFSAELMTALLANDPSGLVIQMPDPVWVDSYAQLFSNLSEMGNIAVIMLFIGIVLREKNTGTIDMMFSKGLSPTVFVLAKFAVAVAIVLLLLFISIFVAYGYTFVLFEYAGHIGNVLMGGLVFGSFVVMLLAIVMFWSTVANSTAISAVLGIVSYFAIIFLNLIPVVGRFMPAHLAGHGAMLAMGEVPEHIGIQIGVALVIAALALVASIHILRNRDA